MSNHAFGLRVDSVACPGGDAACVLNGNAVQDNNCQGILFVASSGYTLTRNLAHRNGAEPCFPQGGITLAFGSSGNKITNNDSSDNFGFGIRMGFLAGTGAASGNDIVNNTATGNALADLSQVVPSENSWNDNNRCNTADGTVPPSVCKPGE